LYISGFLDVVVVFKNTGRNIYQKWTLLPEVWQWSNYVDAFVKAEFGMYFLNSVLYSVVGVSAIVLITSMAVTVRRLEFWGKNFSFLFIDFLLF
jgi:ABC-type glycerol-3-phosphate transport system permease component